MFFRNLLSCALFSGLALADYGCVHNGQPADLQPAKITRFFSWSGPANEEQAAKYASAGVTDAVVRSQASHALALKYGIKPYWQCYLPAGPHDQVMSPAEEAYRDYITGKDLSETLSKRERSRIIHQRRIEKRHRYGGDMVADIDTLNSYSIKCFLSDRDLVLARKALDNIIDTAPAGTAGIYMDFVGYNNFKGCYCRNCLDKYQSYLKTNQLADTQANQDTFYLNQLVEYYNSIIDYVKSRRSDFKVAVHIYPLFKTDPLYGNRLKADFCGQTVSWYFKWDAEKIQRCTRYVLEHAQDYHKNAEGIPFIGMSSTPDSSLICKTPEQVEQDIQAVLAAGGRTLMVCSGRVIIQDKYLEVFKKYCGKK